MQPNIGIREKMMEFSTALSTLSPYLKTVINNKQKAKVRMTYSTKQQNQKNYFT